MTKFCKKCKCIKDITEFNKNKGSKDGLAFYCKLCASIIGKKHFNKRKFNRLAKYSSVFTANISTGY